jgi:alpha-1,3-rhamnosyl/mannosyltransferase
MACGTPVVAFANSGTSEVVDGGGVLVDDRDVAAFTAAVEQLIEDAAHRRAVSEAGIDRARAFSWERCVEAHAEVLRTARIAA